jgi:hypothetical protein
MAENIDETSKLVFLQTVVKSIYFHHLQFGSYFYKFP